MSKLKCQYRLIQSSIKSCRNEGENNKKIKDEASLFRNCEFR